MLHPACDMENARRVARELNASHVVLTVDELEQEDFAAIRSMAAICASAACFLT